MEFSSEILKKIIALGANGDSFAIISKALNMTPDELRDERKKNTELNDALERAEFNEDMLTISNLKKSNDPKIKLEEQKRLYLKYHKEDPKSDNLIIWEEV